MLFDMFNARETTVFAQQLAADIDRLFPSRPKPPTPKTLQKDRQKLDNLVMRTQAFAQGHKLNIYKKAKFLNTIKWTLTDNGHEKPFVDDMVALLARVLG